MHTYAGKTKATQETSPATRTLPARDHRSLLTNAGDARGNPATGVVRPGHDFSRIPVYPTQQTRGRQAVRSSGEIAGGPGQAWLPVTGGGGSGGSAATGSAGSGSAAAAVPTLKKTTVSPLATTDNGGFKWGVQWSIDNATSSTSGWIVQHVNVKQSVEAFHPPLLPGTTMPITPGQGAYGGLSESWYPLWEAWQVRGGSVFVGGSASPHNADTYGQPAVGPSTKGKTEVTGRADFYPGLTLPSGFSVKNAAPAWALPAANTDPGLTGGSGALDHNLTATWDGVGGTGATTATTV